MSAHVLRTQTRVSLENEEPTKITLLDLVTAVADSAESDEEVLATISSLLNSGQVTLVGNFCDDALSQEPD